LILLEHEVFEKVPVLLKGREKIEGFNLDREAIEKVPVLLGSREEIKDSISNTSCLRRVPDFCSRQQGRLKSIEFTMSYKFCTVFHIPCRLRVKYRTLPVRTP